VLGSFNNPSGRQPHSWNPRKADRARSVAATQLIGGRSCRRRCRSRARASRPGPPCDHELMNMRRANMLHVKINHAVGATDLDRRSVHPNKTPSIPARKASASTYESQITDPSASRHRSYCLVQFSSAQLITNS
jgi:hypothetical protein